MFASPVQLGGVGVFPKREEVFVRGERSDASGIGIRPLRSSRLQGIGTSYAQTRQRSRPAVPHDAAVVENLLKLGGGSTALPSREVRFAANVRWVQTGNVGYKQKFA
jgi:hypothetical protein